MSDRLSRRFVLSAFVLFAVAGTGGCGVQGNNGSSPSASNDRAHSRAIRGSSLSRPTVATEPQLLERGWGTLSGRFTLRGKIPTLTPLVKQGDKEIKDADVCAMHEVPDERLVVDGKTRGIRDVFVYLRRKPDHIHPELVEPAHKEITFDQKGCRFLDHALAMRLDQALLLKNSDATHHATHIQGGLDGRHSLPPGVEPVAHTFSRSRPSPFPVTCAFHSWMKAWILVQDHPYFAVSDERGEFTIEMLPTGIELEFRVWHEAARSVSSADGAIDKGVFKLTVEPSGTTTRTFKIDVSSFAL